MLAWLSGTQLTQHFNKIKTGLYKQREMNVISPYPSEYTWLTSLAHRIHVTNIPNPQNTRD